MKLIAMIVGLLCGSVFAANAQPVPAASSVNASIQSVDADIKALHSDLVSMESTLVQIEANTAGVNAAWPADVLSRLDTLIFLVTAGSFTLGGLLGFFTWIVIVIGMREVDF